MNDERSLGVMIQMMVARRKRGDERDMCIAWAIGLL